MSEPPRPREHRRVDLSSLPDPRLWLGEDRASRRMVWRVALVAVAVLAVASGSALVLRGTLGRAAAVRARAEPLLQGLPAGLEAPRPAEKPPIAPEELAALQQSWVGSESIAPRDPHLDPGTGERLGAFHGFGVQVDGAEGARVLANGAELGTSPLLASVSCRVGDAVEIRVERAGRHWAHRTRCRADALLKLAPPFPPPR